MFFEVQLLGHDGTLLTHDTQTDASYMLQKISTVLAFCLVLCVILAFILND